MASPQSRELSELEFLLIILMFGFMRWVENCMEAASFRELNALPPCARDSYPLMSAGPRPFAFALEIDTRRRFARSTRAMCDDEVLR